MYFCLQTKPPFSGFLTIEKVKTKQLHILVGCADSRDLSQLHVDAVRVVSDKFKQQGIEIEFQVIRAAGSFISPDVFDDIKRIIENVQRTTTLPDLEYYVHIQTHGHLTEDSNEEYISHLRPENCRRKPAKLRYAGRSARWTGIGATYSERGS